MTKNKLYGGIPSKENLTSKEIADQVIALQATAYNFALSYTANAEDAKDLLQESTFRALKNHEKFKKGTNFKAWFFTIIKNTFINGRRKDQKKKKAIDTTEDMIVLTNNKEISTENPAHQNIQVASMQELINNLNEDLRKSFVLNFKGYTYQEIADMLHTPLGTIKSRIFFARKALKTLLLEEYPERAAKK